MNQQQHGIRQTLLRNHMIGGVDTLDKNPQTAFGEALAQILRNSRYSHQSDTGLRLIVHHCTKPFHIRIRQTQTRREIMHHRLRILRIEAMHFRRQTALQANRDIYFVHQPIGITRQRVQFLIALHIFAHQIIVEYIGVLTLNVREGLFVRVVLPEFVEPRAQNNQRVHHHTFTQRALNSIYLFFYALRHAPLIL